MRTHQEIDTRSLDLHRLVADKIRRDPALFEAAKATLTRWQHTVDAASQPYLAEWARLMAEGLEPCLQVAVEDSPRAVALRQSSPFSAVLTPRERFQFLKTWRSRYETSGA